jgi:uncharacterized protein YbjT (DUF2867 family)
MRIMVTGALGNVGKFVVENLVGMGELVTAADIDLDKLDIAYGKLANVKNTYFDFTDMNTFDKAFDGVDRVFLMRPPHLGKPEDLLPFVQAMSEAGIKLVSFLSLMSVENNPVPPHHKIEKFIEQYKLPYAHIRPGFFMQNISGVHALEIKEQSRIFVPAGKSKTSFIDARDIGLAIATVLHSPEKYKNSAHTITGPESLDYYQIAEILSEVLGRKIVYARPSFLKYRSVYIKKRGLDKGYVNVTVMLYFMTRMGTAKMVTDGFEKLTGRKPGTFREFAVENINAWK